MADIGGILGGLGERSLSEIFGFGIGTALGNALQPESTGLAQEAWGLNPTLVLDAQTLAILVRLGLLTIDQAEDDAKQTGINRERLAQLVQGSYIPPGSGELLELYRRGELSIEETRTALMYGGMDGRYVDEYLRLQKVLLSPADAAMARQQGFLTADEATARSALQGVDAEDADILFKMSGLPPGAEQMIDLWRRGEVDEARVRQSLIEGHIKIDYADDVLKLRYQPLSASVAAEALIRQRMTEEQAVAIADKNGISRDDFLMWSNMMGRPIATGQALQLARRGQFTYPQFVDAVARSDVRTEFAPDLWNLRRVIPPLFQVNRLVSSGSITDELATQYIIEDGYDKELAAAIVHSGSAHKTAGTRHLAATQIDALYESGLESHDWALQHLMSLGYSQDEATWHLELLDSRRLLSALQAELNTIHRTYVGHKIDKLTASNELDTLGMRSSVRDDLLDTWTFEREANVTRLTNAQIGRAVKLGIIDAATGIARWMENGYSQEDADVLAALAAHPQGAQPSPTP